MAIKDVGFGGTGSSTYETLSTLISEFAPERFRRAINNKSPTIGSGLLQKEQVDDDEWVHTLFGGAGHSTSLVRDHGRLPKGHAYTPVKLREQPCNVVSILTMGRRAAKAKLSDSKLAQVFDSALKEASDDCARVLARSLHGFAVVPAGTATWSGTAANSTVSITFADISPFRPGQAVDFIDTSASLAYVVRVTDVVPGTVGSDSDAIAGTVSFINDVVNPATDAVVALGATAVAVDDVFRTRGETAGFGAASTTIDTALNSFDDIAGAGAAGTLHEKSASQVPGWRGQAKTLSAAYSQEAVVSFMGRIFTQSGEKMNVAIMHPQVAAAHAAYTGQQAAVWGLTAGISAARPMQVDQSHDKFGDVYEGSGLSVGGAKIIDDPNSPAKRVTLFNNQTTKLGVWDEMGPDEESGDPLLLGRQFFTNECQISGAYNLLTYMRSANGCLDGLTSL